MNRFLSFFGFCLVAGIGGPAFAGDASANPGLPAPYWLAPIGGVLALLTAVLFYRSVMGYSEGETETVRIARAVREGAYAYLHSQWRVISMVFAGLVVVLVIIGLANLQPKLSALGVPIAGLLSGLCGFLGMRMATNASGRTTAAAKQSLNDGLRVAFRGGAVMGLCVTGFALLDVSVWFFILVKVFGADALVTITTITLSYAMGASLQALFARVGGGIYTKAADIGADLVGKVEAGIPEDDARNPATIADNVGDNVGDVAGMGADLYESYYGSILAAMALGAAAAFQLELVPADAIRLVVAPPALAGLGIIASVVCTFLIRAKENASMAELARGLHMGVWSSSALVVLGAVGILFWLLGGIAAVSEWGIIVAILAGLAAGLIIAWGTELYTSYAHKPTRTISEQAETGPATVIIAGVAAGMRSTWIPLLTILLAIVIAFIAAGGTETFFLGVFGVGIAAVGMLSTLAITLATDAYGPIADNAGGNAEMSHQPEYVRDRTDMLDSLGNTTAATGKGFAIGSAALTALALLSAYVITVQNTLTQQAKNAYEAKQVKPGDRGEVSAKDAYLGYGRLYVPGADDGGGQTTLILDPRDQRTLEKELEKGAVPSVKPGEAGARRMTARLVRGQEEVATMEVVNASKASLPDLMRYYNVTITNPKVLAGLFVGVMLVFVFCAMTMQAVGRAANKMMLECRRQFDIMRDAFRKQGMGEDRITDPTQWPYEVSVEDKRYPDYAAGVSISTKAALREMVTPSLMAVLVPIAVGVVLGVAGVMGMLAAAVVTGFAVAIFMANAGGAWDNAKKWIETGQHGGKGSEAHKGSVIGDTVGDPFKDTSGPSLNILIKLVSIVSVVFVGLTVKFSPVVSELLGFVGR